MSITYILVGDEWVVDEHAKSYDQRNRIEIDDTLNPTLSTVTDADGDLPGGVSVDVKVETVLAWVREHRPDLLVDLATSLGLTVRNLVECSADEYGVCGKPVTHEATMYPQDPPVLCCDKHAAIYASDCDKPWTVHLLLSPQSRRKHG